MQIDGWDFPLHANVQYFIRWCSFLQSRTPNRTAQTIEEAVSEAEDLSIKHNGLPNTGWLQANGYMTLASRIQRHPNSFSHIPRQPRQRSIRTTLSQAISDLDAILLQHDGMLKNKRWLQDHHPAIYRHSLKHPEMLHHVKFETRLKNVREWVKFAEDLSSHHNGLLPNAKWVHKHHPGLYGCMKTHPTSFCHIPQIKLDRQGRPINSEDTESHDAN